MNGDKSDIEKINTKLELDELQRILGIAFDHSVSKGASVIKCDFDSLNQEFSYNVFPLGKFKCLFNNKKR